MILFDILRHRPTVSPSFFPRDGPAYLVFLNQSDPRYSVWFASSHRDDPHMPKNE